MSFWLAYDAPWAFVKTKLAEWALPSCYSEKGDLLMAIESSKQAWLRTLAIFAHPDDEVFCADGIL